MALYVFYCPMFEDWISRCETRLERRRATRPMIWDSWPTTNWMEGLGPTFPVDSTNAREHMRPQNPAQPQRQLLRQNAQVPTATRSCNMFCTLPQWWALTKQGPKKDHEVGYRTKPASNSKGSTGLSPTRADRRRGTRSGPLILPSGTRT